MVVSVSETFTHNVEKSQKQAYKEQELEKMIMKLMKGNGISPKKIKKGENGQLLLSECTNLKLHKLMLQAEEMGLDLKLTKQMHIEIC